MPFILSFVTYFAAWEAHARGLQNAAAGIQTGFDHMRSRAGANFDSITFKQLACARCLRLYVLVVVRKPVPMLQHRVPHRQPHGARCAPAPALGTCARNYCAWSPSAHVERRIQRNRLFAAAVDVDLVDWPEGTKPKRGRLTKAALKRLKVRAMQQC
jgi:hypothetical protein